MAKLPDIHIYAHHEHKITFDRKFGCKVLKDGLFTVTVPKDLVEEFTPFYRAEVSKSAGIYNTFQAKTHQEAVNICNSFGRWKVEATEVRVLLIFYRNASRGQFWVTDNGLIEPNGQGDNTGGWYQGIDSESFNPRGAIAGVSASVAVRVKITARNGETTYRYDLPREGELGAAGNELKRFDMNCKPPFYSEKDKNYIPYTEKAAEFFVGQIRQTMQRAYDLCEFLNQDDAQLSDDLESERIPFDLTETAPI